MLRRAAAYFLLVTGPVAVVVFAAEAACRLAGYTGLEMYRADPELGWVLAPRQVTVTRAGHLPVLINDHGFRDDPLGMPKPPATVRIFALGASTTFGWGVRQQEVYHQVIERMLGDSARAAGLATRFEIVNAGVIGYNLWQAARSMRRIVERYQPDGFLVAYTFNDGWNAMGTLDAREQRRVLAGVRRKNALRRSALYNWLVEVRARRLAGPSAPAASAQTGDSSATPAELARFIATTDSMLTFARSARLALAFTILSGRDQAHPWPRQAAMARAAADRQVIALDLVPVFGVAGADSLFLLRDAVHPSAIGHEVIARLMYRELCAAARAALSGEPAAVYRAGCGRASGP